MARPTSPARAHVAGGIRATAPPPDPIAHIPAVSSSLPPHIDNAHLWDPGTRPGRAPETWRVLTRRLICEVSQHDPQPAPRGADVRLPRVHVRPRPRRGLIRRRPRGRRRGRCLRGTVIPHGSRRARPPLSAGGRHPGRLGRPRQTYLRGQVCHRYTAATAHFLTPADLADLSTASSRASSTSSTGGTARRLLPLLDRSRFGRR